MIVTWIGDVRPLLGENRYKKYYQKLPPHRKEKADRLARREDRALSVGAWTLLEAALREYRQETFPCYNLSHSFPYALCSFAPDQEDNNVSLRVGCDVESIKEPKLSVARHYFRPAEYDYIMSQPEEEGKKQAFFRYWVLKESFLKVTGKGMGLPLDSFEIQVSEDGCAPSLTCQPREYPETYYFKEYPIKALDAKAAVCSTCPDFASALREMEFV